MKDGFVLKNPNHHRVVLLFHGMTGSPFEMLPIGKVIHRAGFDVICPKLPGHCAGEEAIKKVKWYDWKDFTISKTIELSKEYDEVHTAGLCLGAILSFIAAMEKPDIITSAAGLSTTLFLDGWSMPWYKFLFPLGLHTVLKFFYSFPENEPYGIKNEKMRERVIRLMCDNSETLDHFPMISILELERISKYFRTNIKKLKSPIIIFHSIEDDLTSIKSADFVYKNAASPIKEYFKLYNSYHLITIDNEKDLVAQKMIQFFEKNSREKHEKHLHDYAAYSPNF